MTGTIRTSLDQTLRMYGNSYPMPEWIIPIGPFLFFTYHFGATDQTGGLALLLIAGTTLPVLLSNPMLLDTEPRFQKAPVKPANLKGPP